MEIYQSVTEGYSCVQCPNMSTSTKFEFNPINSLPVNVWKLIDQSETRDSRNSEERYQGLPRLGESPQYACPPNLSSIRFVVCLQKLDQQEANKQCEIIGPWRKYKQDWGPPRCLPNLSSIQLAYFFVNARDLLNQSEARKWQEFCKAWPKVHQSRNSPQLVNPPNLS